jgi:hypothetical protein
MAIRRAYAASGGEFNLKRLIDRGANPEMPNLAQKTPMEITIKS